MVKRARALLMILAATVASAAEFNGSSAFDYTQRAVNFGPRPPGSKALRELETYIRIQLSKQGWESIADSFVADTPRGQIPMSNIIARLPGSSGRAIVITGHYDTKFTPEARFVGANDGGSSTGLLLELARVLPTVEREHDIYLVWFDGEEAFGPWSATDGLYGSRHLAGRWDREGFLEKVTALINVDMIGDKNLDILREEASSETLREEIWAIAEELGHGKHFAPYGALIDDDHAPFLRLGVNAIDLIDFTYGPERTYWHTSQDTMDKLAPASFEAVGRVLVEFIRRSR